MARPFPSRLNLGCSALCLTWRKMQNAVMHYVYLLESVLDAKWRYVGFSSNLRQRLIDHNDGKLPNTARYRPWRIVMYASFASKKQALAFEHYLKSGSGHAFANKRLWPRKV